MIDGVQMRALEALTVDVPEEGHQGGVMQVAGERRGEMTNMERRPWPCPRRISHPGARPDRLPERIHEPYPRYRADLATSSTAYAPHRGDIPAAAMAY